jgi:hypothetical protein
MRGCSRGDATVVEDRVSRKWLGAGDGGGQASAQRVTMLRCGLGMASPLRTAVNVSSVGWLCGAGAGGGWRARRR